MNRVPSTLSRTPANAFLYEFNPNTYRYAGQYAATTTPIEPGCGFRQFSTNSNGLVTRVTNVPQLVTSKGLFLTRVLHHLLQTR